MEYDISWYDALLIVAVLALFLTWWNLPNDD